MRTQGEIEAAICEGVSRFEQDYMGRGPKDIHAHLLGDLLVVRLQGVLTAAEQHLVKSLPAEKGRDLLKQVRTHLIETARPVMEAMVQEITGVKVLTPAPRHQHRHRRGGRSLHPCRVADSPRREEEIAVLTQVVSGGRRQLRRADVADRSNAGRRGRDHGNRATPTADPAPTTVPILRANATAPLTAPQPRRVVVSTLRSAG